MILDQMKLDGKVAVVTGGGRGIGEGAALALAEAGADVVLASRNEENLARVAEEIRGLGRQSLIVPTDVSCRDQIDAMVARTVETFGKLDILVNNAGMNIRVPSIEYREEDWDKVLNVNLKAVFLCCQAAGRPMMRQGGGKIINVASMTSVVGIPTIPAYCSSKGAVVQLTKTLAVEWASHHINVNAVGPGFIETDLTGPLRKDPERSNWILGRIPMGRWGRSDDLKGAFVFLASPASDYVTGTVLFVDGGWLAG